MATHGVEGLERVAVGVDDCEDTRARTRAATCCSRRSARRVDTCEVVEAYRYTPPPPALLFRRWPRPRPGRQRRGRRVGDRAPARAALAVAPTANALRPPARIVSLGPVTRALTAMGLSVAATRRRASTTGATTPSEMAWRCIFALPSAVADDAESSDKEAKDLAQAPLLTRGFIGKALTWKTHLVVSDLYGTQSSKKYNLSVDCFTCQTRKCSRKIRQGSAKNETDKRQHMSLQKHVRMDPNPARTRP